MKHTIHTLCVIPLIISILIVPMRAFSYPKAPMVSPAQHWVSVYRYWDRYHRDWQDLRLFTDRNTSQNIQKNTKKMFLLSALATPKMDVALTKWWHPKDQDWVTIPSKGNGHIAATLLIKWGYKNPTFLGFGSMRPFNNSVKVYRWWHPKDRDWVTIPSKGSGSISDRLLRSWGYKHKKFVCYANQGISSTPQTP